MQIRQVAVAISVLAFCAVVAAAEVQTPGAAHARTLNQRRGRGRTPTRPPPEGGDVDDWEFIKEAVVQGLVPDVFSRIENPRDALVFAFGELIYESISQSDTTTKLVLNSGEDFVIENTDTGIARPGLFHVFKIVSNSDGVLSTGGQSISVAGSQFYILLKGVSSATVEIGWLGVVNPESLRPLITSAFEGIIQELVDRFKSEFRGGDCVQLGPKSVVRDISGVCNNIDNTFAQVNAPLSRVVPVSFGDGQSSFGGSDISPRAISNIVAAEESNEDDGSNPLKLTDMFVIFGQFVDHDIGISPVGSFADRDQPLFSASFEKFLDEVPIEIPDGDPFFEGVKEELPFERAVFVREDNQEVLPRKIVNQNTAFLDLSQVYGSTALRMRVLRSFQDGKLKTSGPNFLPFNGATEGGIGIAIENAPDASTRFYVAGDIRPQENVLLLVLHVIWLREHNKIADELKGAFGDQFDDEELFQFARAIAIAEWQSILYTEWLPLLIGSESPSPDGFSYNPSIDAGASAFFTTVSFRFGHSMINPQLWLVDPGNQTPSSTVNMRDNFFQPEVLTGGNHDSFVRGMAWHEARNPDEKVIDDLRSFLYRGTDTPDQDLVALNIQRARDMGIPTYNAARNGFGLSTFGSFSDISDDPTTVSNLEEAYEGDVDIIDAFVGGLAEKRPSDRLFGDLFTESFKEQFTRMRDGDRFFYSALQFDLDVLAGYPRLNDILANRVKLIDIIERNTDVSRSDFGGRATLFQL
ncbi:hypothetical protein BSKO_10770 [Bryopsis sp. KO-2023]|nr:hypothetical protein BSKO_10770 [Bryopsis sp. KO-2023]